MSARPHRSPPLLAGLLALSACAANGDRAPAADPDPSPGWAPGTSWRLVSLDGGAVPERPMVTLEIDTARVGGYAGCNAWGGVAEPGPADSLEVSPIESTAMACIDPAVMELEGEFLRRVAGATRIRREGDRLVLDTRLGPSALVFERLPESVGDPRSLVGTSWRLESLAGREPRGSYTMAFPEEGVAEGRAGCRSYQARYTFGRGRISFVEQRMSGEPCDEPGDELWLEEGDFTDALTWAWRYVIEEDRFEIRTMRGEALVFARAPAQPFSPFTISR